MKCTRDHCIRLVADDLIKRAAFQPTIDPLTAAQQMGFSLSETVIVDRAVNLLITEGKAERIGDTRIRINV